MKALEQKSSFGFWLWGFVFLFLIHAFAIFWFSSRTAVEPLWEKPTAFLYLPSNPDAERRIGSVTALYDPTLFALPHADSFSGRGWRNPELEIPKLTNWFETPEWLALSVDQLGGSLNDYMTTNRLSDSQLLAALRATRSPPVRISDAPVFTRTMIQLEGQFAARKLLHVPELPAAEYADVLRPTVVRVSVNGDGIVEAASIAGESGSKAADAEALMVARQLMFALAPVRDARARQMSPPAIGSVVFTWNIVPTTNAPATASAR
jgi:hypothetical protein